MLTKLTIRNFKLFPESVGNLSPINCNHMIY